MNDTSKIDKELKELANNYTTSFNQNDEKTLFFFIQMNEIMYTELSYEVYDKDKLYDLVCNNFKSNTNLVFSNMKDYYSKTIDSLINEFCKIVKVSVYNKYINANNLSNIYTNFKTQISTNTKIDEKIKILSNSNGNLLLEQIHTNCIVNDSKKITNIVKKYVDSITEEMIKNITIKNEVLLSTYKSFIDSIVQETIEDLEKIKNMNLKVITNTTYIYLKEQEYFVIEKYTKNNSKLIDNFFVKFENSVEDNLGIKKQNSTKLNSTKDYLHGFNNTVRVKSKNIFDEMNFAVTLENGKMRERVKEFNDLISHIYELNLKFDKLFEDYKKEFNVSAHNRDKFNEIFDKEYSDFYGQFKANLSNIFRENTKIYNDILYKSIILKSRINEFNEVLSESKVKDLLLK